MSLLLSIVRWSLMGIGALWLLPKVAPMAQDLLQWASKLF